MRESFHLSRFGQAQNLEFGRFFARLLAPSAKLTSIRRVDDQTQAQEARRHLDAAMGYLDLGLVEDANDAIERLPPAMKATKAVLGLRLEIYSSAGAWEHMLEVANFLVRNWPDDPRYRISLAYATRRCRSVMEAEKVLLEAARNYPTDPIILFNLSCYAAQIGNLDEARDSLVRAINLNQNVRLMALHDPDLEPLWASHGSTSTV